MNKIWKIFGLLLLSITISLPAQAQRNKRAAAALSAQRGEMLSQSCFSCHGPRGASFAPAVPSIGGQGAVYLVSSLMRFREDKRAGSIMGRIAKGYSEPEIMEIAQYLSALPFQRNEQVTDVNKVELGAVAYRKVCSKCHGESGRESVEPDYPVLAGQRLLYMQMQMHEINASGKRPVDSMFLASIEKLSKEELDSVLHYFASQK